MQVLTSILKNATGEYFPNGCSAMIDKEAQVVGKVHLATVDYDNDDCGPSKTVQAGDQVEATHPVTKRQGLKLNDPQRGVLVLDETPASFGAKANACCIPATTTVP